MLRGAQDAMQVFVKLKALGSASVEDLLHALLTKLPLPPPNGTSPAVRPCPCLHSLGA